MSEAVGAENAQNNAPAAESVGPGQMLRQARTGQDVPLEALAATLKVPVEKLQALEDEDWQALPDVVFARSLTMSVCRNLRIPAQPILDLLPQQQSARLNARPSINEPVRDRAVPSALTPSAGPLGRRLALLSVLLLAGAALAYAAWQWQQGQEESAEGAGGAAAPASPTSSSSFFSAAAPEADQPLFAPGQVPADAPLDSDEAGAAAGQGAAVAPAPQASAQTDASAASVAEAPAAAAGGTPALRLRATGEVWVQVRDADGSLVVEKILKAGEVVDATARRPLSVVLGKADVTEVEIDGAPFDVLAKARDNVARFEVK